MKLSPEHWRVLNALFHSTMYTIRPPLIEVSKGQDVTIEDIDALFEATYIAAVIGDDDLDRHAGLHKIGTVFQKRIRLRLTTRGKTLVMDTPANQIRYTLSQLGATTLDKLFGGGNTLVIDDVTDAQRDGLITAKLADDTPIELTTIGYPSSVWPLVTVTLTPKGREYLPR